MSDQEGNSLSPHMTEEEVLHLIDIVEEFDPVVVGGQAVNIWVQYFRSSNPNFLGDRAFTSKDIDFYRNQMAAERLADELGGQVLVPQPGDATPNAAVVVGKLGGRTVTVDFMATVLGVEERRITNNQVMIEARSPRTNRPIRILLLHPLDCLRSRLANINTLKRHDAHSVDQAIAAQEVLLQFLNDILDDPRRFRHVQTILLELAYTIRDGHSGRPSHLLHGLAPQNVLDAFQNDTRLDPRWRELILAPCRERVARWISVAEARRTRRQTDGAPEEAISEVQSTGLGL